MKLYLMAIALVATIFLSTTAEAAKQKPPAPNLSASAKVDLFVRGEKPPNSIGIYYDTKVKIAISHSFTITPEQEAALQTNTKIEMLGLSFLLSESPGFQNGDKSATIEKILPAGVVDSPIPITVKLKWGNGKFSLNLKGAVNEKDILEVPIVRAVKDVKDAPFVPLSTTIQHPSIPDLKVEATLAADAFMSETEGGTAEGLEFSEISQKISTKFFTTPPAP